MSFALKQDESDARDRLNAFWSGSSLGRPALHVTANRGVPAEVPDGATPGFHKGDDLVPSYHVTSGRRRLDSVHWLAEAMPSVDMTFGSNVVLVAVMAGGDYDCDEAGRAWIKPSPDLWDGRLPSFNGDHPVVKQLTACYLEVCDEVHHDGFINPPSLVEGLTTLSELVTPESLCLNLVDQPTKVKHWVRALDQIYVDIYDYFYRLLVDRGYMETSSWLLAMAEGKFDATQCDAAVMLSPEMFGDFVMPELAFFLDYLDYSLYHLDGTCQLRFLDQLSSLPKLNGIQWNPEPGAGSPALWTKSFQDIRQRGLALYVKCDVDEAVKITREIGPDGLMLVLPTFDTVEQAEHAIRSIQRVC